MLFTSEKYVDLLIDLLVGFGHVNAQATGVLQEELQQEAHACMAIDAEVEELR